MGEAVPPWPGSGSDTLAERLGAFLSGELGLGPGDVRVVAARRLAGGASREIWALDAELARGGACERIELVLRKDPAGRVGDGGDRSLEFHVLRAAADAGVPVPRALWASADPRWLGAPFFLMDRIAGETLPRRLLRDARYAEARERLVVQLGEALARIHAIDWRRPELGGLAAPPAGCAPARSELERVAGAIRELAVEPHPVLDLAERWLLERAPEAPRRALVHGDYRIGNVIFDERGLRAILDWELAHVGDPIEDLGWLCTRAWRFGSPLPAGGVGTRERLVEAYEAASGTRVDPAALRFWEAFGSFKLALVFITQARVALDGRVQSVELASLGRRTAEAEDELLRFLESGA
jgi:aminoglycoside phosphotransferase (APT) family kinase protein